jgi:hypothetical protein
MQDTPISDVKCLIEALLNVPATRQRLIYKGRVLRDADTVQGLGEPQQCSTAFPAVRESCSLRHLACTSTH